MRLEWFQMSAVLFICILEISFSRPGFLSPVTHLMVPKILEPILRASGFALFKKMAVPKSSVQFLPLEVLWFCASCCDLAIRCYHSFTKQESGRGRWFWLRVWFMSLSVHLKRGGLSWVSAFKQAQHVCRLALSNPTVNLKYSSGCQRPHFELCWNVRCIEQMTGDLFSEGRTESFTLDDK